MIVHPLPTSYDDRASSTDALRSGCVWSAFFFRRTFDVRSSYDDRASSTDALRFLWFAPSLDCGSFKSCKKKRRRRTMIVRWTHVVRRARTSNARSSYVFSAAKSAACAASSAHNARPSYDHRTFFLRPLRTRRSGRKSIVRFQKNAGSHVTNLLTKSLLNSFNSDYSWKKLIP